LFVEGRGNHKVKEGIPPPPPPPPPKASDLEFSVEVLLYAQVIADNTTGLLFKNKRDRKVINVDPKVRIGKRES
jgi:hypothetical protein